MKLDQTFTNRMVLAERVGVIIHHGSVHAPLPESEITTKCRECFALGRGP